MSNDLDVTRAAISLAQMVQVTGSGVGAAYPCTPSDRHRQDGTAVSFAKGWTTFAPTAKRTTGANATGIRPEMSLIQRQLVGVLGVPPRGEPV